MINHNEISGISEVGLNKLITDIYDYADASNRIINQINDLVYSTSEFFRSDSGDLYRKKFSRLCEEHSTIKNNILSYTSDFANVKAHYKNRNIVAADIIKSGKNESKRK